MLGEGGGDKGELAGEVVFVGIEPGDDDARRSAETLVDRVGLAVVGLRNVGEGVAAFLTVGSLGAITAENWNRHGPKDWRTIVAGSLCAVFYLGNIYGSYLSVSIENNEHVAAENTAIVYHLHIPLRSIFR